MFCVLVIDSSAKLQTGFMRGNIMLIGNYDECLNIYEDKGDDGIIEGQYCTVALTPAKNVSNNELGQILDFTNVSISFDKRSVNVCIEFIVGRNGNHGHTRRQRDRAHFKTHKDDLRNLFAQVLWGGKHTKTVEPY